MKGFLAFVLCLAAASGHVLKFGEYKEQWQAWKSFHDKKYATDTEEDARYAIWRDNLRVSARTNCLLRTELFMLIGHAKTSTRYIVSFVCSY